MGRIFNILVVLLGSLLLFSSCKKVEQSKPIDPKSLLIKKADAILNGDIVLQTHAFTGSQNRTLLPEGCPTMFNFKPNNDGTITCSLLHFHVGRMPFIVNFSCVAKFLTLNKWEKQEHPEDGWLKFEGKNGRAWADPNNDSEDSNTENDEKPQTQKVDGSSFNGMINVNTEEIIMTIDYNMMSVQSRCNLQKIDKSRTPNYKKDLAEYEKALAKYKKDHGLD